MSLLKSFAKRTFDFVLPGPSDGKNGALQSLVYGFEEHKRDCNLGALFEIYRRGSRTESIWSGLGTLGYEIVKHFRPRRVVELGTYEGFSACAMALALRDLGEGGTVRAVDTWEGDPNTHAYNSDEVYQRFSNLRKELGLEDVIVPLRMTFEKASQVIEPGIDILHIDGWHTYRAVSTDFKQFRPLLAPGAIVMFHDVNNPLFRGMRLFWRRVSWTYPSVLIPYSSGLGIIQVT